ncbi:oligopeptide/dipeptide ABC transporter ATP-binding protein [Streptomyces mutabilis]|uniref:oligopeptide/dipeptide ABC transporter ATP-binding protein n=1 Tax=Streptomyces mutabilis TaxID=67332 RepID=UPI003F6A0975
MGADARTGTAGPGFPEPARVTGPAASRRSPRGLLDCSPTLGDTRRALSPVPGRPPSLGDAFPGCPFAPRCPEAEPECATWRPEAVKLPDGGASACRRTPGPCPSPSRCPGRACPSSLCAWSPCPSSPCAGSACPSSPCARSPCPSNQRPPTGGPRQ